MERRTFLRGLAVTLSLPTFESLGQIAHAAEISGGQAPTRLAYIYTPNGVNPPLWHPTLDGSTIKLGKSLSSLQPFLNDLQIIRGLDHDKARANGDGPGDHARANATFLTGVQAKKTAGSDIQLGVSADQIAAQAIGNLTRVPSLELSTDPVRRSGNCDSGYSCAYQFNLAWKNESTPMPPERYPRRIFEKLFGSGNLKEDQRRRAYQKSVLDFVLSDTKSVQRKLGADDHDKFDAYVTAVREVERQIEAAEKFAGQQPKQNDFPVSIPKSYKEHIRLMYDMMALAFQTDTTRVSTFLLAHDGSNRPFPEIGVRDGHHSISHHRNDPKKVSDIAKIDTFYAEQFAYFLNKLKSTPDGIGKNLLDNSMILFGSGITDGNRHNNDDLPIILAGHGGDLKAGRLIKADKGTPMTNLHLSLLKKMGVEASQLGDSTGLLKSI